MRKPDRRTVLALLFALAAGIATAAFQPGDTPETNGLVAAKAVAAKLADAIEERTTVSATSGDPVREGIGTGLALLTEVLPTR